MPGPRPGARSTSTTRPPSGARSRSSTSTPRSGRWSKPTFGYEEENPTLKNFLLRLLLTDYAHHLKGDVPQSLRGLLLPRTGWSNAVVCLAQWRDSSSKGSSYDRLSAEAAAILKIEDHLPNLEIDQLLDVMTFLAVEKRIASSLRERVQTTADTINADDVRAIATRRQAGHWASPTVAGSDGRPAPGAPCRLRRPGGGGRFLRPAEPAQERLRLSRRRQRCTGPTSRSFTASTNSTATSARPPTLAEEQGWNIVKPLRADIEAHYVNWYLTNLALAWGKFIEPQGGLLAKWQIDKVPNQYRFYDRNVRPWLEEGDNRRAFVIISDAFRYEAAQELTAELNGKYRFEATLSSQLGVLPSYTALGMASLLPHKTLAYKANGDVLVDGKSSIASERDGILQAVGGMACKCRRTDGEEEGRGPGVRQGQAGRLHLPQHGRCRRRRRPRPKARRSRRCGRPSTNWRRWSATSSTT